MRPVSNESNCTEKPGHCGKKESERVRTQIFSLEQFHGAEDIFQGLWLKIAESILRVWLLVFVPVADNRVTAQIRKPLVNTPLFTVLSKLGKERLVINIEDAGGLGLIAAVVAQRAENVQFLRLFERTRGVGLMDVSPHVGTRSNAG